MPSVVLKLNISSEATSTIFIAFSGHQAQDKFFFIIYLPKK